MPALSVVMPIYNAQPYLTQCMESVCAQTLADIEIICVNDGSTDDSLEVLERFAAEDARVKVLSKPNGGYGHTMNYGIERATGDFVAIVEPDDFLDPHMYEDLLGFAEFGGQPADIVKSSYWEFFDGRNGYADALHAPQLANGMPREPRAFGPEGVSLPLQFHPSIWSAIYRRSFLLEAGIRFIEPKGAGWADNPFAFETMLAARRVVWVPKAYYHYRLTNLNASTYVKDFHMPFDRMRDVRGLLHERQASSDVWAAFYRRELNYIASIIGEYGFSERDPEVMSLIREALQDMDGGLVHSSDCITAGQKRYFDEFLAYSREGIPEADVAPVACEADAVELSIVVPAGDNVHTAVRALASLAQLPLESYEVICACCGPRDRTPLICRQFATESKLIRVLPGIFDTVPDAANAALDAARGTHVLLADLSHELDGDALRAVLEHARTNYLDVALVDEDRRFVVEALRSGRQRDYDAPHGMFLSQPFSPAVATSFLLNCCAPDRYLALYRTAFLKCSGLTLSAADDAGACGFAGRAAMSAHRVAYCACGLCRNLDDTANPSLGPHELRRELVKEPPLVTPSAIALAESLDSDSPYWESACNLVAESFALDLERRGTTESMRELVATFLPRVNAIVGECMSGVGTHNPAANVYLQLVQTEGLEGYLGMKAIERANAVSWYAGELRELDESATMRLGRMAKKGIETIVPRKAIDKLRSIRR